MLPYLRRIQTLNYFPSPFNPVSRPARLRAKLQWQREHIAPALENLFFYYRDTCNIIEGEQPHHSKNLNKYDEIGRRLAAMWSKDEVTPERKVNHYSYAENRPFDLVA